jgi:hypothetical protein
MVPTASRRKGNNSLRAEQLRSRSFFLLNQNQLIYPTFFFAALFLKVLQLRSSDSNHLGNDLITTKKPRTLFEIALGGDGVSGKTKQ